MPFTFSIFFFYFKEEKQIITESEAELGIRFRMIETGVGTVKSLLHKSNPTTTVGCEERDCLPYRIERGEGVDCGVVD